MDWYEVLKAARRVGSRSRKEGGKTFLDAVEFTAAQLADEAGLVSRRLTVEEKKLIEQGEMKPPGSPNDLAAAWIGKFVRWGYVHPTGKKDSTGGRPVRLYALTRWGLRFERKRTKKPKHSKNQDEKTAANPEDE